MSSAYFPIISFVENSFQTLDNRPFNLKFFPTAKSRADEGGFTAIDSEAKLTQREVGTFLDYNLAISIMRNATEDEINDVFGRINTYGHRLSDQERRQAGVENDFSDMVRDVACIIRGDASAAELPLKSMPSISIDLPMSKHGYEVHAEEVFWVEQGILRSTDLRDSMDEQCIADIAGCIIKGELIERSKDSLDEVYEKGSNLSEQILSALEVYGRNKFTDEFKYCIEVVLTICNADEKEKLRDIIFKKRTTNAFPSVFAIIFIAIHELIVRGGKKLADPVSAKAAIRNIVERIETGRQATSVEERRRNINTVKGQLDSCFETADISAIYQNHTTSDIEALVRRSEIEVSNYELKQGMLPLSGNRKPDPKLIEKVINTICAIANNGNGETGKIVLGVANKIADKKKIQEIDGIEGKKVGRRWVVGIEREARAMKLTVEAYFSKWKQVIQSSALSPALRDSVLSNLDYNSFYGLGVIVITIPPQSDLSYVGDSVYWRNVDSTELADTPRKIAMLAQRF